MALITCKTDRQITERCTYAVRLNSQKNDVETNQRERGEREKKERAQGEKSTDRSVQRSRNKKN